MASKPLAYPNDARAAAPVSENPSENVNFLGTPTSENRQLRETCCRYRTATAHLLRFLESHPVGGYASHFQGSHAEAFVHYLRGLEVAPNGHAHAAKRPLMDKGIHYVLETCRALFNYAARRRHLPPYAENPFRTLPMERLGMPHTRAVVLFTSEQEQRFLEACDDWQFPLFLTLLLTGLRSGELTHLLLPEDLDLHTATLRVRNEPQLGWQVKTRKERDIPLVAVLVDVLRQHLAGRSRGPVFLRRRLGNTGAAAGRVALRPEQEREEPQQSEPERPGGPALPGRPPAAGATAVAADVGGTRGPRANGVSAADRAPRLIRLHRAQDAAASVCDIPARRPGGSAHPQ